MCGRDGRAGALHSHLPQMAPSAHSLVPPGSLAYRAFQEQFLTSPVRTEDPSEAHFFYVPTPMFAYTYTMGHGREALLLAGGLPCCWAECGRAQNAAMPAAWLSTRPLSAVEHLHNLLDHLKHTYPYWNRTGGRDHFYVSEGKARA